MRDAGDEVGLEGAQFFRAALFLLCQDNLLLENESLQELRCLYRYTMEEIDLFLLVVFSRSRIQNKDAHQHHGLRNDWNADRPVALREPLLPCRLVL